MKSKTQLDIATREELAAFREWVGHVSLSAEVLYWRLRGGILRRLSISRDI